jgi:hypothetical protein
LEAKNKLISDGVPRSGDAPAIAASCVGRLFFTFFLAIVPIIVLVLVLELVLGFLKADEVFILPTQ